MNDSTNSGSDSDNKTQDCCASGTCGSPMQCTDWKALSERAKAILVDPKGVWPTLKAENKSIKAIYISYVIPLMVLGSLCGLLGGMIFSGGSGLIASFVFAIVQLALGLGLLYVNSMIYKSLASVFGGSADETSSFKLVAYAGTAAMVGTFLSIVPPLAVLSLLFSLYSLYTIYQGIPVMTGVSERRLPYFISCIVVSIVASMAISLIVFSVLGIGAAGVKMM